MTSARFSALVLAGRRPGGDVLAESAGLATKALLPIAGRPMLLRVLDALRAAASVDSIRVVGLDPRDAARLPELEAWMAKGEIALVPGRATPSTSVLAAIDDDPSRLPLLVTTADHPLLRPETVDLFCARARAAGGAFAVGLVDADTVRRAYPDARRTWLRFRGRELCSCNLFALLEPAGRNVPAAWVAVEAERKRPWKLVSRLGPLSLARFFLGRLSLDDAFALGSRKLGAVVRPVFLDDPRAAIDVDRADDRALVETILAEPSP